MSNFSSQNFDQNSQLTNDDNFENDDLFAFQHDLKSINLYYSQLTKYSKHIRETYVFSDVVNRLPQEINKLQEEFQIFPENVDLFFQLSQQNYNINEDSILTYIQCVDLLKISKFLEVRKLSSNINQYIKSHNIDVDFIIQMIQYDVKTQVGSDNQQIGISKEMEEVLTSKINECLSNEKFKGLPIEIIYRVIEKSSPEEINSNKLFDIIIKSLSQFCVLFPFLELQKLSDDRLSELCEMYSKSNENTRHYFDYLKCNLNLINEINNRKKNLEEMNDEQRNKMKNLEEKITSLQNQFRKAEKVNDQLQSQLNDSKNLNNQQQNKMSDLETKITSLQSQLNDSKNLNNQQENKVSFLENKIISLQTQFNDSEKVNDQLKSQLNEQQNKMKKLEKSFQMQINEELQNQVNYSKNLENQISQLQKQFKDFIQFQGEIIASAEYGLFINAEINLKCLALDTTRSKVIISTSNEKCVGSEAYEKGEPITSLHMTTSFACKPGRYYVRCIVFNSEGESKEIVSNPVTTSVSSLTFNYEGKTAKISLPQGQYKLEVWGAKGGDSNRDNKIAQGGLGGYSRGILRLNKKEVVYVFVGEEGRSSNSSDGSSTKGGFPDGGGTKTGHCGSYTTVPGTGGGSTSIRIGSDTNYSRVIVAGGGGGASGDNAWVSPGGFGGGLNGGNCYYMEKLRNQGAGTQTGSTRGLGEHDDRHGDPGVFGSGATGNYRQGCDSGGGGGGGWYGGGSGGFGANNRCSSGGGGSGWTFTETSHQTFLSGDKSNASKFELSSTYYLTEAICYGGNEEFPCPDGNGNEKGHSGNGYAKITPI